jgi:hypothetical protein
MPIPVGGMNTRGDWYATARRARAGRDVSQRSRRIVSCLIGQANGSLISSSGASSAEFVRPVPAALADQLHSIGASLGHEFFRQLR